MRLHPSDRLLDRFADRALSRRQHARVSRHLEGCGRCRSTVLAIRNLGREARALETPPLPAQLRRRVLTAVAENAAIIVPIADPTPRVRPWQRLAWLGTGLAVLAVGAFLLLAPAELSSEASVLEFAPAHPAAGARIEVSYRATSSLAGSERLRLRARYRRPGDPQRGFGIPQVVATTLDREHGRTYRGALQLPADVVYAVFAVEDEAGRTVDSRGRLGWELLVFEDGQPSYAALLQRAYEAVGRDLGLALRAATEASERYPHRVPPWALRSALELEALGSSAYDSLRALHLTRLRAFDVALHGGPVSPDNAASMYFYARTWNAQELAGEWYDRILQDAPNSPAAVQLQTVAILAAGTSNPDRTLDALQALSEGPGAGHPVLAQMAYGVAREAGDPAVMFTWAQRRLQLEPWVRLSLARDMVSVPALRDTALAWLAEEGAVLERRDDARRPLYRTVSAQRSADEQARREVLGLTGRALLAEGHLESGLAFLDSATAGGWDLQLFQQVAEERLRVGRTAEGIATLARLAVDPAYGGPDIASRALALVGPSEWGAYVEGARGYMIVETLREAHPGARVEDVRLRGADGAERELRQLLDGQVGVVGFYWPTCRACLADLRRLQDLQGRLGPAPPVVLVSRTPLSAEDLAALRAEGIEFPLTVDAYGEATDALQSWDTTEYFVVDRHGVIRFAYTTLEKIPRQVLALRTVGTPVT